MKNLLNTKVRSIWSLEMRPNSDLCPTNASCNVIKGCHQKKKKSVWRDIVPTRGEGVKKRCQMSQLKIPF